jgi:hypothetical protein
VAKCQQEVATVREPGRAENAGAAHEGSSTRRGTWCGIVGGWCAATKCRPATVEVTADQAGDQCGARPNRDSYTAHRESRTGCRERDTRHRQPSPLAGGQETCG